MTLLEAGESVFRTSRAVFNALRGAQPSVHALFRRQSTVWGTSGPRLPRRVHGLTRSTHAEIRYLHTWKSVNLAWAVRISGDGGQEGRHLAPPKKGCGGRRTSVPRREPPKVDPTPATHALSMRLHAGLTGVQRLEKCVLENAFYINASASELLYINGAPWRSPL